jgi:APA family basic amino acid/polyamine antiporter
MKKTALTLPMLIAIVVGNMIGTGIFVLPASLAQYGTISLLSWVFTSIGALLLALTFTHLNKRYPKTGGPYAYCKQAFGRLVGFIIAIIYWFSNLGSIAGISVASIGYLGFVFPALNANSPGYDPTYPLIMELAVIWLFTFVNILGLHFVGIVQLFLTTIKVTPLIIIILFGLGHVQLANLTQFTAGNVSHFTAISSAAALTFWAFIGLEAATIPAENTRGPRDISRATIWGTLISSSIYIASTFVLMGMISISQLKISQFPFAEAGAMLFGPFGALLIAIFACISGIGALNVCILIQGQIVFSAARDNIFPHWLAKLSKNGVPIRGHLISSILVSLLLIVTMQPNLLEQFNFIALIAALLALTTYLASTFAEIKFIVQSKASFKHMITNKSTIISILAAAYAIWMISSMNAITIKFGFITILCCIPIYYFFIQKTNPHPSE